MTTNADRKWPNDECTGGADVPASQGSDGKERKAPQVDRETTVPCWDSEATDGRKRKPTSRDYPESTVKRKYT
jgi:hypothetical protein